MPGRTFLAVYDSKKMFPISGTGWVVEKRKHPTMRHGSQSIWVKKFPNEKEAREYAEKERQRAEHKRIRSSLSRSKKQVSAFGLRLDNNPFW